MATRLDSSCVLPPNYELTILVAGEGVFASFWHFGSL